jgi:hypothetical protein
MTSYRLTPDAYIRFRNRLIRQSSVLFGGMLIISLAIVFILNRSASTEMILSRLVSVSIAGIVAVFIGVLLNIYSLKVFWSEWSVEIGDTLRTTNKNHALDVVIRREEVSCIEETAGSGLFVYAHDRSRKVYIPNILSEYDEIKTFLMQWALVKQRTSSPTLTLFWLSIAYFVPISLLLEIDNLFVVILSTIVLLGSVVVTIIALQRQKQLRWYSLLLLIGLFLFFSFLVFGRIYSLVI